MHLVQLNDRVCVIWFFVFIENSTGLFRYIYIYIRMKGFWYLLYCMHDRSRCYKTIVVGWWKMMMKRYIKAMCYAGKLENLSHSPRLYPGWWYGRKYSWLILYHFIQRWYSIVIVNYYHFIKKKMCNFLQAILTRKIGVVTTRRKNLNTISKIQWLNKHSC